MSEDTDMLRSILAASLLAVSFPTAAEALNYNIVEFSESAGVEVAQDTMSARFQVAAGRTGQKCRQCRVC